MPATLRKKISAAEPYLLMIPALLVVALLILYPIVKTFSYSMMEYSPIYPDKNGYIGFGNFTEMMQDEVFIGSLSTSLWYATSVVVLQFICGLALALLMRPMTRFKGVYRAAMFSPWAVSGVLTAIMWKLMFNGSYGAINDLLTRFGLMEEGILWGTNAPTAFAMGMVASVWRGIPYFAINMLAALLSVPEEVCESARIDGAGSLKLFWHITLPYLRESIVLTTMLRTIWTFNDVDILYSLTGGGPNNATLTLPVYIVRHSVEYLNFGYGSALTVALFFILLVFALLYMQLGKSNGDFSA